jgi:O-palmitoleoyl-L-serine hydrolase
MAIAEHMSPLVVRNRRPAGHPVAVAAPLFVLLALLAAFSGSPVAAAEDSSPVLIELTLVAGAQEKGAGIRCRRLDFFHSG